MDLQADAQTALISQGNELTSAQADDSAVAFEYKKVLGSIKTDMAALLGQIQAAKAKLGALKVSHEQLIAMFLEDVGMTYPELKGQSVSQVLAKVNSASGATGMPLVSIWEKYHSQIVDVEQGVAVTLQDYNEMMDDYTALQGNQDEVIRSYTSFYDGTDTLGIPDPDQMIKSSQAESLIPLSDARSLIASADIMDYLDPEAAAAIELQLANNDQMDLPGSISDGLSLPSPSIKLFGIAVGLAALAYIFLGGSNEKQTN